MESRGRWGVLDANGAPTFSQGIVGGVYLVPQRLAVLSALTAHTFYRGGHETAPLADAVNDRPCPS